VLAPRRFEKRQNVGRAVGRERQWRNAQVRTGIKKSDPLARPESPEDAIDALVCAWVGIAYLEDRVVSYGDATAPIWSP